MDTDTRRELALWRLGVLGPLVSARLLHGDRRAYFREAAARTHQRPDGRYVRLSARTIEGWYYRYRNGGLKALEPKGRSDRGHSRAIPHDVAELLLRAKREKPRRSIRRLIRILERAGVVVPGQLSRSAVHRLLRAHSISSRPVRGPSAERRSFLPEHAGDLWMGDSMHGPLVIAPDRRIRKSYMLSQLDAAVRFLPHSYFAVSENAAAHEHGFKQAVLKHGPPRAYYVDRGAAYRAHSLVAICGELGIQHILCDAGDCEAKGGIERFHRTWREEVGDELPDEPIPLAELNAIHWAWLSSEYHRREHTTTGRAPLAHWLAEAEYLRPVPGGVDLDEVFLHRTRRKVRKDGTVRFRGMWLEVQPELVGQTVELRFEPVETDALPRVFVEGKFVCDTVVLDRHRNATRKRRRGLGAPEPQTQPSGLYPLEQIKHEHYRRTRPTSDSSQDNGKD